MIAETIATFLMEIIIVWPGAFIRWLWFKRKKTIAEFANEDTLYNYLLSFLLIIVVGTAIALQ